MRSFTLLLTGDKNGLVGPDGHFFDHNPTHYERLRVVDYGEVELLRADIARHVQIAAEQAGEIERLTEALQIVAAPLKINGDDHASAVKHARAALAAKEE